MLHSFTIVTAVSLSLLLPTDAGLVNRFVDALEDFEKVLEPTLIEVAENVGDIIHNTTRNYSWEYVQDVFSECIQDCWTHLFDEEAMEKCVSDKKESCEIMKNYSKEELMLYYSPLLAGGKVIQMPGKAISAALGLKVDKDDDSSMKKRAVDAGVKLIETSALEKITESFFDSGKIKALSFLESINSLSNDFEKAIHEGIDALGEMVDSGKKLADTEETEQLKSAIEDGKLVVRTALQSSKKIAKEVTALPIQSTVVTSNYALDNLIESGINLVKSDEAVQLKTAIGDGKNAVTTLLNSGKKLTESVKSIPLNIVATSVNCSKEGSGPKRSVFEEVEQIKIAIENGKRSVGTLVDSSLKLADSLTSLPITTAKDVGNFAIDSLIESGLNIAKSDEAMLLNAALIAGKNTTGSVVGSGKKLVESAVDIPLQTASDIKNIALDILTYPQNKPDLA